MSGPDDPAPEYCDTITVMRAPGRRLAKMFTALDADPIAYDDSRLFDGETRQLSKIEAIADLLGELIRRPDCMVVRGGLIAGPTATRIRRLVYADDKTGDAPTLVDLPRKWLAIDCDGVERPADVSPHDLLGCAEVVLERLPSPFMPAACIVQATAGHGIKPGIRLRLWFWLSHPLTTGALKRWIGSIPGIDRSVFNPAQPIYTAAPVFGPGLADPLPARLLAIDGLPWVCNPTEAELAPPPRPPVENVKPVCVSGSARARLYVDGALSKAHSRISGASQRHPIILSEACGLARFVNAGLLTEQEVHNTLWNAAQQAGKDDEAEIKRMVAFGMTHPDTTPLPVEIRHG